MIISKRKVIKIYTYVAEGLYYGIRSYILLIASLHRSRISLKFSHDFLITQHTWANSLELTHLDGAYPPRVSDFEVVYLFIDIDSDQKVIGSPHCICSILKTR